jgi:hypothetical protein
VPPHTSTRARWLESRGARRRRARRTTTARGASRTTARRTTAGRGRGDARRTRDGCAGVV